MEKSIFLFSCVFFKYISSRVSLSKDTSEFSKPWTIDRRTCCARGLDRSRNSRELVASPPWMRNLRGRSKFVKAFSAKPPAIYTVYVCLRSVNTFMSVNSTGFRDGHTGGQAFSCYIKISSQAEEHIKREASRVPCTLCASYRECCS